MLQVFFVLRKKDRQISFLHVYHHASQALFTWAYLKYLPGNASYIAAVLLQNLSSFSLSRYEICKLILSICNTVKLPQQWK
jgi:elongation of very long chain fatty acids protein 4